MVIFDPGCSLVNLGALKRASAWTSPSDLAALSGDCAAMWKVLGTREKPLNARCATPGPGVGEDQYVPGHHYFPWKIGTRNVVGLGTKSLLKPCLE